MVNIAGLLASSWLLSGAYGASSSTSASYSQFTIPTAADVGANLIANIDDHEAVNAQSVCPGYKASNVHQSSKGFTATLELAGKPCNAYGIDVDSLDLSVEYQAKDRLNIYIVPSHVDSSNASWYFLNGDVVPRPKASPNASAAYSDLALEWSNEPSFNFKATRKATGDVLFNTEGSVLVYENQFIEFVTSLPEDYNIYGLGEHFQQLRILHNATLTAYGSDNGNPIDSYVFLSPPLRDQAIDHLQEPLRQPPLLPGHPILRTEQEWLPHSRQGFRSRPQEGIQVLLARCIPAKRPRSGGHYAAPEPDLADSGWKHRLDLLLRP